MIYTDMRKIQKLKPHTKIWACAFELDRSKSQMGLFQEPIYGEIRGSVYRGKESENPYYFMPYKKNSIDLAKSKSVSIYSRYFADTYEECRDLYNHLIEEKIKWFIEKIEEIEKKKI